MATPQELAQEVQKYESSHPGLSRSDAVRQVLREHHVGRLDFEDIRQRVRVILFEAQQANVSIPPSIEEELRNRIVVLPEPKPEEPKRKKKSKPSVAETSEIEPEDGGVEAQRHRSDVGWIGDYYDN